MRRRSLVGAILTAAAVLLPVLGLPAVAAVAPHPGMATAQVSADPYLNRAAQHATEVEPDTVAAGHTVLSVFQVGRWGNGCADNIGWAKSTNGTDWQHGYLPGLTRFSSPPGPFVRASDPAVAYNAAFGEWIVSSLACNGTSPNPKAAVSSPAVEVNISFDGVHWSKAIIAARIKKGQHFDKEWITCDNSPASRFYGNCYMQWDLANFGAALVQMITSRDGGFHWSAPATTRGHLHGIGGEPVVQPNGTVVVPILGFIGSSLDLVAFRSTNGGRSWGRTTVVTPTFLHFPAGNLRGPVFQTVAEDAAGRIYVSWPDCRFRPACSANDMVLTTSADGVHWTPVTRIPIDPVTSTVDHIGGGLGADPTTSGRHARLGLFYYFYPHADCTVATCRLYMGYVSSTDGGRRWSAPRVLAGPMRLTELPRGNRMVGDYQGAAVVPGGNAFAAFAVAGIPSGAQHFNEAMYDVTGGVPVTGGSRPASPAGIRRHLTPAGQPGVVHTR